MPTSPDLSFQQLSTVQNAAMPSPPTIASAATIVPTTFITRVTGTVAIANVTPPIDGQHMLCIIPTGALPALLLTGNIGNVGAVSTALVPFFLVYDPNTKKYYASGKA